MSGNIDGAELSPWFVFDFIFNRFDAGVNLAEHMRSSVEEISAVLGPSVGAQGLRLRSPVSCAQCVLCSCIQISPWHSQWNRAQGLPMIPVLLEVRRNNVLYYAELAENLITSVDIQMDSWKFSIFIAKREIQMWRGQAVTAFLVPNSNSQSPTPITPTYHCHPQLTLWSPDHNWLGWGACLSAIDLLCRLAVQI